MKLSRPSRFIAALLAVTSLLFAQLAVAWYECPGDRIGTVTKAAAATGDHGGRMIASCEGMDAEQPSLCHAHGQAGNQSIDKPGIPHVQPFMAAGFAAQLYIVKFASDRNVTPSDAYFLTRVTAPPIAIRNCCFRI